MVFLRTSRELVSLLDQVDEESGTLSILVLVMPVCIPLPIGVLIASTLFHTGHVKFHPPQSTQRIIRINKKPAITVDLNHKKDIMAATTEPPFPSHMTPTTTTLPATPPSHHGSSTPSSATKRNLSANAKSANKKLGTGPWVMARFYGTLFAYCRAAMSIVYLHRLTVGRPWPALSFFVCDTCRYG
jgi:hypothetical protein